MNLGGRKFLVDLEWEVFEGTKEDGLLAELLLSAECSVPIWTVRGWSTIPIRGGILVVNVIGIDNPNEACLVKKDNPARLNEALLVLMRTDDPAEYDRTTSRCAITLNSHCVRESQLDNWRMTTGARINTILGIQGAWSKTLKTNVIVDDTTAWREGSS